MTTQFQSIDWRLSATACKLAQAIYYAQSEAFGLAIKDWSDVDYATRQGYVERAVDLLEEYRPVPKRSIDFAGFAAQTAREVFAPGKIRSPSVRLDGTRFSWGKIRW